MFGVIIFIPLFFQGVLGASATNSGSFLTPMMLGIVAGAIVSGQALSRLGAHYRLQGLVGLGIMAAGMFLLSQMSAGTGFGRAVGYIVVMGIGLGVTFPVYTLVVQNSVPRRVLGVATSSLQFFRSIGGTLGLAILGSIVTSRFASDGPGRGEDRSPTLGASLVLPEAGKSPEELALIKKMGRVILQKATLG